jgi:hypothetical protein
MLAAIDAGLLRHALVVARRGCKPNRRDGPVDASDQYGGSLGPPLAGEGREPATHDHDHQEQVDQLRDAREPPRVLVVDRTGLDGHRSTARITVHS